MQRLAGAIFIDVGKGSQRPTPAMWPNESLCELETRLQLERGAHARAEDPTILRANINLQSGVNNYIQS